MKKLLPFILLVAAFIIFKISDAQSVSYDKQWEKIENYVENGLPQSALKALDSVHNQAISEKNQVQQLKSIQYRFNLIEKTQEDQLELAINYALNELNISQSPASQWLHSIIAELYVFYYQQHKYELLARTNQNDNPSVDLKEWDLAKLRKTIEYHYNQSLIDPKTLKQYSLTYFSEALLNTDEESLASQPTVFDFLSQRVIDYYLTQDAGLQNFTKIDPEIDFDFWCTGNDFLKLQIPDTDQPITKALSLLQELMLFHRNDKNQEVYLHYDVKRIRMVREYLKDTHDNGSKYLEALRTFQTTNINHPVSAEVAALRATELLNQQNGINQRIDTSLRWNTSMALGLCNEAIQQFPDSRGAKSCEIIKNQILEPSLLLQIQQVNLPGQPVAMHISYRNLTKVHFRLVKVPDEFLNKIMNFNNDSLQKKALLARKPRLEWDVTIPFESDYQLHTSILGLPSCEKGLYILLASPDQHFGDQEIVTMTHFQCSLLGQLHRTLEGENTLYVLDRETGKAIRNAEVILLFRDYNYQTNNYIRKEIGSVKTDKEGKVILSADNAGNSFTTKIIFQGDTLYNEAYLSSWRHRSVVQMHEQTTFFTDRSIYRPGQTVYFKGIVLDTDNLRHEIKTGSKVNVQLMDANWQQLASLTRNTNEFGSFEGSFEIPANRLNGQFTIRASSGSISFQVEENKRPSFEVKLDIPETQYAINEVITINGTTKAYAGYPLDGVDYTYQVQRAQDFPYWRSWWGYPPFGAETEIIAQGKGITAPNGEFNILFPLLPGSGTAQFDPRYAYTLTVEVTDRNGETHMGKQTVYAAEKALILSTNITNEVDRFDIQRFKIYSTNLNGKAAKAHLSVSYYRMTDDKALYRANPFPIADRQLLSNDKLNILFPLDHFYLENDPAKKSKSLVFQQFIDCDSSINLFTAEAQNWKPGNWYIEIKGKDAFGKEVNYATEFLLTNTQSQTLSTPTFAWMYGNTRTAEPGQTIDFQIGSSKNKSRFLVEISANGRLIHQEWMEINNEKIKIPYLVAEADRGSIRINMIGLRNNQLLEKEWTVHVPFSNKILDTKLITKRERLTPGGNEHWTIKVKDALQNDAPAELMAVLYDASLDALRPHHWYFHPLPAYRSLASWSGDGGYNLKYSSLLNWNPPMTSYPEPIMNPILNWFGFSAFGGYDDGIFYAVQPMAGARMKMGMEEETVELDVENDKKIIDVSAPDQTLPKEQITPLVASNIRSDFRETAFFYPQLQALPDSSYQISFTLPDALTQWRLMLLAHTKDLKSGSMECTFTASKDLIITPNVPRFLREGDTIALKARVVNTSDKTISGKAVFSIWKAQTELPISNYLTGDQTLEIDQLEAGKSIVLNWRIMVPQSSEPLLLRFSAISDNFTDIEQHLIPVLPRKTLVTESLVLNTAGKSTKVFSFDSGRTDPNSKIEHAEIQIVSNPSWYAVEALPYLQQEETEVADGVFNRYYVNTLASIIASQIPETIEIIRQWKTHHPEELRSELEKNKSLKAVLLQETPWLMEARNEREQRERIALLFDLNRMQYEQDVALQKLKKLQTINGAWSWFPGMPESEHITNRIVAGIGKLNLLKAGKTNKQMMLLVLPALNYLDREMQADYQYLITSKKLKTYKLSSDALHYLYARSFFMTQPIDEKHSESFAYFLNLLERDWKLFSKGQQAMAALVLHRYHHNDTAQAVIESLREHALYKPSLGMYWKYSSGYHWYTAPIESQSLIIEAFEETQTDLTDIDLMRSWLLSQKQTHQWESNSATAEAIYALLARGSDWFHSTEAVELVVDQKPIEVKTVDVQSPVFTINWESGDEAADFKTITIKNPNNQSVWGSAFRQYFEDTDRVKAANNEVQIRKEMFVKQLTDKGFELIPIHLKSIEPGDHVVVRLVLSVDRDMEYMHLKDQRAAGLEPLETVSGYEWKGGLGYYQSVRDASTDFFFETLRKGKYVFEYELIASQTGDFTNGMAVLESFYSPAFSAHSSGNRIQIVDKK